MAGLPELLAKAILTEAKATGKVVARRGARALPKAAEAAAVDPFTELRQMVAEPPPGMGRLEHPDPLSDYRVPQRRPSSYKTGDPQKNLLINMDVVKQDPKLVEKMAAQVDTQPWATKQIKEMAPAEKLDAYRDFQSENLQALYEMMPPVQQRRAANWYEGAHELTGQRARETGLPHNAVAGGYGALSPQMDWYKNVYLGDTTARTLARDPKITRDMIRKAETLKSYRDPMQHTGVIPLDAVKRLEGKTISKIDDPLEKAFATRLWDETYGTRQYHTISPEGEYRGIVRNLDDSPSAPGWGTFGQIQNSIEAMLSGGDQSKIYEALGGAHKVPQFYNSIIAPVKGRKYGDFVADTHAGAGGHFMPMSGQTPEISKMLSGPPTSQTLGVAGTYPITADAGRLAAERLGIPVPWAQSVPWEAIRTLFPPEFKKIPHNVERVRGIWQMVGNGQITRPQARETIIRLATGGRGFQPPTWVLAALSMMGLGEAMDQRKNPNA